MSSEKDSPKDIWGVVASMEPHEVIKLLLSSAENLFGANKLSKVTDKVTDKLAERLESLEMKIDGNEFKLNFRQNEEADESAGAKRDSDSTSQDDDLNASDAA